MLAQMALVPQVLPDRLDMVLLVRNLVFAVLLRLVALRAHPVTALLDRMVQQVPMVVVVSVLKVVERLDMATALLVRMAMVRVLPDEMPDFVVWQFLRMVLVVLPVDTAQNRRFRKRFAGYMVRRMRPCVPVLLVSAVFVRGMPAVRMVVMMCLWVLLMDCIGIRPVGFLLSRWRVDSPVWLAQMAELLLIVPNRVSVVLLPIWKLASR